MVLVMYNHFYTITNRIKSFLKEFSKKLKIFGYLSTLLHIRVENMHT